MGTVAETGIGAVEAQGIYLSQSGKVQEGFPNKVNVSDESRK